MEWAESTNKGMSCPRFFLVFTWIVHKQIRDFDFHFGLQVLDHFGFFLREADICQFHSCLVRIIDQVVVVLLEGSTGSDVGDYLVTKTQTSLI